MTQFKSLDCTDLSSVLPILLPIDDAAQSWENDCGAQSGLTYGLAPDYWGLSMEISETIRARMRHV
jgi:hypothetical protein